MAPPLFHLIWNNIVSNLPQWDIPSCKHEWKGGGAIRKVSSYPYLVLVVLNKLNNKNLKLKSKDYNLLLNEWKKCGGRILNNDTK